jgi:hypothetical protein
MYDMASKHFSKAIKVFYYKSVQVKLIRLSYTPAFSPHFLTYQGSSGQAVLFGSAVSRKVLNP